MAMIWRKRVVVIDDDQSCRNLFSDMLSYIGVDVVTLPTARGAFEQIKESKPDMVICDMIFNSRAEGLALIEQLHQDRSTRSIPVILCSAAIELTRSYIPSLESIGVSMLAKPFDLDDLYTQLDEKLLLGMRNPGFVLTPLH